MLDLIKKNISDIVKAEPLKQRIAFQKEHWIKYFSSPSYGAVLAELITAHPSGISRQEIIDYCSKGTEANRSLLKGFISCMVWGFGVTGYGAHRLNQMLININSANSLFEKVYIELGKDNLQNAYMHFVNSPLRMCGQAFFTKYLYFVGRSIGMKEYPLILDQRVTKSLFKSVATISENEFPCTIFSIMPKNDFEAYSSYVRSIHKMATEIGCEAENIEYYLFAVK